MHAGDPSTAAPPPPPPGMPAPHHQAQALLYPSFPYPPPAPSDPPSAPLLFSHIPNPNPIPNPEPISSVIPAPYPVTYLQGCTAPEVPALAYYPFGGVGGTLSVGGFDYGSICQNGQTAITDLEMKKQKLIQGGAPAGAVRVCAICNVVCNSEKVFVSHLAGEKHKVRYCSFLLAIWN
ncbi:hypothetical protein J5N97_008446 [Dioscorea zingiberensis]|uniref:C2H2-type domain-containing protein n=1 Tax=Dioscorea zingiberensis TaxID=325984 RepID=A0A9D5HL16_9LILI|nr:hypothetical protein J5N97_008446 [Dioscorea zingiberensis]